MVLVRAVIQETFSLDVLQILKHSLKNFEEHLKKMFSGESLQFSYKLHLILFQVLKIPDFLPE